MGRQIYGQDLDIRKCSYCGAEEGKLRLIGDFLVKLHTVEINEKEQLVCQSCLRKNRMVRKAQGLVSFYHVDAKPKLKFRNFLSR